LERDFLAFVGLEPEAGGLGTYFKHFKFLFLKHRTRLGGGAAGALHRSSGYLGHEVYVAIVGDPHRFASK